MRDSTGHIVHYNPGEPPEVDRDEWQDRLIGLLDAIHAQNADLIVTLDALMRRLDRTASASSVEIKTSTRGADVAVKVYDGSPDLAAARAADVYAELVGQMSQRVVNAMGREAARGG